MAQYDYDLFTIGAGSGGVRASRLSASFGAKVAVAEERYLGGTCVNVGCIPRSCSFMPSHYGEDFSDAAGFGWTVGEPRLDWAKLIANKNKEIHAAERRLPKASRRCGRRNTRRARGNLGSAHRHARRQEDTPRNIFWSPSAVGRWCRSFPARSTQSHPTKLFILPSLPQESDHRRRWLYRRRVRRNFSRLGRAHDAALSRRIVFARLRQ